ncbi:MAG: DEDD exonuclease domain-containing protein [Actinomycetaceae bacterium]|nr:DEDD exonuclease domain-containing protein [Actinomycetaceae bacterium]
MSPAYHRRGHSAPGDYQPTLNAFGPPLSEVTFIVIDIETTGEGPGEHSITEIAAVKVRGGEVLGEFSTLVNPQAPIPAFVTVLTGITQSMVALAPPISAVMPAFVEFIGNDPDVMLVAHNAKFDIGHLKGACAALNYEFPARNILDTVKLARRTFSRDEVRNYKLATLAQAVGATTTPTHRALDDARATVDLLHAILDRLGALGVTHYDDLLTAHQTVPQRRRLKAHLADNVPASPGVYQFIGPNDEILYIGTSANMYKRVRTYFTAAEQRKRIGEMVDIAVRVEALATSTILEANVHEVRLIEKHEPRYNRRSRKRTRHWITLTTETYPRLKISRTAPFNAIGTVLGPFTQRRTAVAALELINDVTHLRSCTERLPKQPDGRLACHVFELDKCNAPCVSGRAQDSELERAKSVLNGNGDEILVASYERMGNLAGAGRYEQAAQERDRLYAYVTAAQLSARILPLLQCERIVAAAQEKHGWEIIVVSYGELLETTVASMNENVPTLATMLNRRHPAMSAPRHALERVSVDELRLIDQWLWRPNVRLLEVSHPEVLAVKRESAARVKLPRIASQTDVD